MNLKEEYRLNGADIQVTGDGVTAFDIQGGSVALTLAGSSTLKSDKGPGLRVATAASLTVDGTGSLAATSNGGECAGIGGKKSETSGAITINGGTITAQGATYGTGIGGGSHGVANVTINGGNVTANGGSLAAGIGGGTGWEGNAGNITINGGFVKAVAGGGSAAIGCGDEGGHNVYPAGTITITGGTIEAEATSGAGIGACSSSGDSGRGPQIYISGGSVKATSTTGSAIGQGAGKGLCPTPLTQADGEAIYLATVEGAKPASSATFTVTRNGAAYGYTYTGSGHSSGTDLYFYLPNGFYVVNGGSKEFSGTIDNAPASFTRYSSEEVTLSVAQDNVSFTSEGVTGKTAEGTAVSGFYGKYTIVGTSTENAVTIASGTQNIVLDTVDIQVSGTAFDVQGGNAKVTLTGANVLASAGGPGFRVANGASASFDGTGALTATSTGGESAGLGGKKNETSGQITINGGTITATGATYATGIGGGSHGVANVTINGGNVTANAGAYAAGIGGGTGWEGNAGNVTINGGFVKATSWKGAGIGCGDCGGHGTYPAGTVTITGGTVEASSDSGAGIGAGCEAGDDGRGPNIYISGGSVMASSNSGSAIGQGAGKGTCPEPKTQATGGEDIYCATLPGAVPSQEESAFTTERDKAAYSYTYSGKGHSGSVDLFFYLPDGDYAVNGSKQFRGTVDGAAVTFTEVPEPCFGLVALLALAFLRRK